MAIYNNIAEARADIDAKIRDKTAEASLSNADHANVDESLAETIFNESSLLDTRIVSLESSSTDHENRITTLEAQVGINTSDIAANQVTLGLHDTRITNLENAAGQAPEPSENFAAYFVQGPLTFASLNSDGLFVNANAISAMPITAFTNDGGADYYKVDAGDRIAYTAPALGNAGTVYNHGDFFKVGNDNFIVISETGWTSPGIGGFDPDDPDIDSMIGKPLFLQSNGVLSTRHGVNKIEICTVVSGTHFEMRDMTTWDQGTIHDGLLAHWLFGDQGITADALTVRDVSGNDSTGTVTGGPLYRYGDGYASSTANGAYATVNADGLLNDQAADAPFTISGVVWLLDRNTNRPTDILSYGSNSPTDDASIQLRASSDSNTLELYVIDSTDAVKFQTFANPNARSAFSFALRYDGSDVQLYVHGEWQPKLAVTNVKRFPTVGDLRFGRQSHSGAWVNQNVVYRDVRFFGRSLLDAEVDHLIWLMGQDNSIANTNRLMNTGFCELPAKGNVEADTLKIRFLTGSLPADAEVSMSGDFSFSSSIHINHPMTISSPSVAKITYTGDLYGILIYPLSGASTFSSGESRGVPIEGSLNAGDDQVSFITGVAPEIGDWIQISGVFNRAANPSGSIQRAVYGHAFKVRNVSDLGGGNYQVDFYQGAREDISLTYLSDRAISGNAITVELGCFELGTFVFTMTDSGGTTDFGPYNSADSAQIASDLQTRYGGSPAAQLVQYFTDNGAGQIGWLMELSNLAAEVTNIATTTTAKTVLRQIPNPVKNVQIRNLHLVADAAADTRWGIYARDSQGIQVDNVRVDNIGLVRLESVFEARVNNCTNNNRQGSNAGCANFNNGCGDVRVENSALWGGLNSMDVSGIAGFPPNIDAVFEGNTCGDSFSAELRVHSGGGVEFINNIVNSRNPNPSQNTACLVSGPWSIVRGNTIHWLKATSAAVKLVSSHAKIEGNVIYSLADAIQWGTGSTGLEKPVTISIVGNRCYGNGAFSAFRSQGDGGSSHFEKVVVANNYAENFGRLGNVYQLQTDFYHQNVGANLQVEKWNVRNTANGSDPDADPRIVGNTYTEVAGVIGG